MNWLPDNRTRTCGRRKRWSCLSLCMETFLKRRKQAFLFTLLGFSYSDASQVHRD